MSKYYIASPFFTEEQIEYCESLEDLLTKTDNSYYSPREHGDTQELQVPEYFSDLKRSIIFKNNIDEIDKCDSMVVNLIHKDMGTYFEFGYACGINLFGSHNINIQTVPKIELNFDLYKVLNTHVRDLTIYIRKDTGFQDIIKEFKRSDHFDKIVVDSTFSQDNYMMASFALGLGYISSGSVSYISPVKSLSNLMITESGIKQYLTPDDLKKDNPVVYDDKQIR